MISKRLMSCGVAMAVGLAVQAPAFAANIKLIDLGGVKGSAAEQGFNIAAAYWSSVLTNNVTINLGVKYGPLGAGIIGSTGSSQQDINVSNYLNLLNTSKSNSTLDTTLVKPTLVNGGFNFYKNAETATSVDTTKVVYDNDGSVNNKVLYENTSVVKAIGGTAVYNDDPTSPSYNPQHLDGSVTFSSTFGFDFNPTDGVNPNTFDFIGVAIHEIGHALGFVSGVDFYDYYGAPNGPGKGQYGFNNTSVFSALDLYRYSTSPTGAPALNEAVGGTPYFSINGGATQFNGDSRFSTGSYNGDGSQASHWKDRGGCSGQIGIMDPNFCYQQIGEVSATDLAAFDAIGWNTSIDVVANPGYSISTVSIYNQFAGGVPEPSSWAMMIAGFGLVGGALRANRRKVAFAL